ncbi:MAG: hypothetical protein ACRCSR_07375 [Bacteroidales bacterium]
MGDILKFLFVVVIGGIITFLIVKAITAQRLKEEALERSKEAFKLEILKKRKNSVHVGIFDAEDNHITNMCIKGEKFSKDIYDGNIIYV